MILDLSISFGVTSAIIGEPAVRPAHLGEPASRPAHPVERSSDWPNPCRRSVPTRAASAKIAL
jgi:hypothetical protein